MGTGAPLSEPTPGLFSALREPGYGRFWTGTGATMFAIQVQNVALPWIAYDISGSGLDLGFVGLARGLTMFVLSPVGGAVADRSSRKPVLLVTMAILFVLAAVNAGLVLADDIAIWHLVVLGILQSAVFSLHIPSRQAHIPVLVRPESVPHALALNAVAQNATRVAAPVLAGIMLAQSPGAAFVTVAVMFGACWVMLLGVAAGPVTAARPERLQDDIVVGFRYAWSDVPVRRVLVGVFAAVLLGTSFQFVLPIFQHEVLDVGATGLGAMHAAVGVGAVLGSVVGARRSGSDDLTSFQWGTGIGFGISLVLLAGAKELAVALAVLVLMGFASQAFMTVSNVLLVVRSEAALFGRVSSINLMSWAMMPAGALPMGALAEALGTPFAFASAGAVLILAMVVLRARDASAADPAPAPAALPPALADRLDLSGVNIEVRR